MSDRENETSLYPIDLLDPAALSNRRQHRRIEVNQQFSDIEEYISEYVSSISSGGVFIRSKKPLPIGTIVNLRFSIILDDIETVEGEGEVVRVDNSPENTGIGVAFTRLTGESKRLIDYILETRD